MTQEKVDILKEVEKVMMPGLECPLSRDLLSKDCTREWCAWWVDNKCATVSIAQSLRQIAGKGVK
jgi:hypothetical protein